MGKTRDDAGLYPQARWFLERTYSFKEVWEDTPWQRDGERKLKSLEESLRKYAPFLNRLPRGFIPSVCDQHLAVLSTQYEYQVLDILLSLGDDRFLCAAGDGERFCVWSRSLTESIREGTRSFLTALIQVGEDAGGARPVITYGPILSWNSLATADFALFGSALARDLFRSRGLPAVIQFDPVPFWALWTLSNIPRVHHGSEEFRLCWHEGVFASDPESLLSGPWKRDILGRRVRLRKPGSKPFFEQTVIYDTKTLRGILMTRRGGYLEKLKATLARVFLPDPGGPSFASPALEIAFKDILKKDLAAAAWTGPFDDLDKRIAEEESRKHPEREKTLEALNAAMNDLIPHVNSGVEPDWDAFASEHGLRPADLDALRLFFRKYGR